MKCIVLMFLQHRRIVKKYKQYSYVFDLNGNFKPQLKSLSE